MKTEENEQLYNKYELVGRVTKQSVYLKREQKEPKTWWMNTKVLNIIKQTLTHTHTWSKRKNFIKQNGNFSKSDSTSIDFTYSVCLCIL